MHPFCNRQLVTVNIWSKSAKIHYSHHQQLPVQQTVWRSAPKVYGTHWPTHSDDHDEACPSQWTPLQVLLTCQSLVSWLGSGSHTLRGQTSSHLTTSGQESFQTWRNNNIRFNLQLHTVTYKILQTTVWSFIPSSFPTPAVWWKFKRTATDQLPEFFWAHLRKGGRVQIFGNNLNKTKFYAGRN